MRETSQQYTLRLMSELDSTPTLSQAAPPLDALAARRWQALALRQAVEGQIKGAPWLHEEVGKRMAERLSWIKTQPANWVNWRALEGGRATHAQVAALYPGLEVFLAPAGESISKYAIELIANTSLQRLVAKLKGAPAKLTEPVADGAAHLLWANMALHTEPDPAATVQQWHRMLAVNGFLMFSCLGPDTAKELREIYAAQGFGPLSHPLTDMHDWGDLLVRTGFAEPVMDMERVVLSFATPERALQELRGLGRNLHPARFAGLRGKAWRAKLLSEMQQRANKDGQIELTFEVIYGHAFKPVPRVKLAAQSAISMRDMRSMLMQAKPTHSKNQ
jgi:malonyl-CoA O-methyltransferase